MTLRAKTYISLVIALGAAAAFRGALLWDPHDLTRFLCYLLLAAPASCLKVRLPGVTGTMSVLFLFLLAAIVELGLPETLAITTMCVVVQSYWRPKIRPKPVQVVFSISVLFIASWAADFSYRSDLLSFLGLESPFRLALVASVFFVGNTFPVAAVIALTENRRLHQVWKDFYSWSFPYYLLGAAVVGMFGFVNRVQNWQAWMLILPLVYAIYRSYHLYLDRLETQRRRAEAESRHAEEVAELLAQSMAANARLEAVIQSSPLAILALDRGGTVKSWNATAERMFGWSADEVLGYPLPSCGDQCGETITALVDRTLRGESLAGFELAQWRKSGTSFEAAIWTAPLWDGTDAAGGILLTVADVSDRKRLEEQLRMSQKMEAIGRLAGGIAHDFNNLLTIINGYSAMLVDDLRSDPYAASQAEEILRAGNRAGELVSQLMSLSRRQMIKPAPLDVNGFVLDIERMLSRLIGEHIRFETSLGENVGAILADQNQITGIMMNLVTNARDAMPDGGVLTIATVRVNSEDKAYQLPDGLESGEYVCLTVSDTGHGMDRVTQEHIFEPFFTTKEKGKGTGLGLCSVYGSVQQNGGRIAVDSEIGKGTSFSIYLPAIEAETVPPAEKQQNEGATAGSETILLVEDEDALRRMLREALAKAGYRVWEAGNGEEGLQQWQVANGKIDLVVSDVVMPGMNGLKLAQELMARSPDVPVIFMSGHAEDVITKQGVIDSERDLLPKPFLPEVLVRKVREVLDHAKRRRAVPSSSQ
jgi:PAS domain S-box-containing protein